MKKIVILCICCLLFIVPFHVQAEEENQTNIGLAKNAKSAIIIEASTGTILFEKNAHEKLAPASMTKMMSMLLIVESIDKGIIKWDDMVTTSENASGMGGSQILLETNEQMSVKDLFKGIAVASGNDAVVAMAEKIAGTEENFVTMMNNRAKELGLKNTNFKNPHGLEEANHYSSAYDMGMIAKELVKHEEIFQYTSIYEDYLRKGTDRELWLVNTNKLVRFYKGVDGLKTGYTKEAGYCLTATAKKDGMRIITVVMGEEDAKVRQQETTEMLDYAFAQYEVEQLLSTKSELGKVEVEKGKSKYSIIVPSEEVNLLHKKIDQKKSATYELHVGKIKAPVKNGDVVGTLDIKEDDNVVRKISVTVKEDMLKASFLDLYLRYLKDIFSGDIIF
ncbi:MAG: D-alanyl-D-alanine carboxypeptidase [Bacilli bacterium]|nr:D-alanyl-D-alanine carboxypeptidase [Bacilli bacterium]